MLTKVTLTGADDTVNPARLLSLSKEFPFVEWGILIGSNYRERFPSLPWYSELEQLIIKAEHPPISLALHICGKVLDRVVNDGFIQVPYSVPLRLFKRAQLNFHGDKMPDHAMFNIAAAFASTGIIPIIQLDGVNDHLMGRLEDQLPTEVHGLYDQSHGAGVLPSFWPSDGLKNVGFAGGLGSANVVDEIEKINSFHKHEYWIDMETKLRSSDDMFDIEECRKVLELCKPYVK